MSDRLCRCDSEEEVCQLSCAYVILRRGMSARLCTCVILRRGYVSLPVHMCDAEEGHVRSAVHM